MTSTNSKLQILEFVPESEQLRREQKWVDKQANEPRTKTPFSREEVEIEVYARRGTFVGLLIVSTKSILLIHCSLLAVLQRRSSVYASK